MNCFSRAFSWFYWESYKGDVNQFFFAHDVLPNGYEPHQLCVPQKYGSHKEEILHHISCNTYTKCLNKASRFMASSKVKRLLSIIQDDHLFRYGIALLTPITRNHILSVILYCDLDAYSTKFSKTFRRISQYETMYSVKRRNAEFWWQAKLLIETVKCYGQQDLDHPLFCMYCTCICTAVHNQYYITAITTVSGVSCVMPLPQLMMYLYSPTSTSKQIEIAINFAGYDDGMIMTIGYPNDRLQIFFDCSWISRYPDEDERLFFHTPTPIEIEAVRITEFNTNYSTVLESFLFLDILFSEEYLGSRDIARRNKADHVLIEELLCFAWIMRFHKMKSRTVSELCKLMELFSKGSAGYDWNAYEKVILSSRINSKTSDPYVTSMFNSFITQKKHLKMHFTKLYGLWSMDSSWYNLIELVIEDANMEICEWNQNIEEIMSSRANLLSLKAFDLAPTARRIKIHSGQIEMSFPFNLFYFLENLSTSSNVFNFYGWDQIWIICMGGDYRKEKSLRRTWISHVWDSSSTEISEAY